MRNYLNPVALAGACSLIASLPSLAAVEPETETPFYVKGDIGGQVTQDTKLREFFGEPLTGGNKITFDPGFRMAFVGGFRVTDWFATEVETGVMVNNIRSISGASEVDAFYSNTPLLINARFQCPKSSCLSPYFGGGLGMAASVINADRIDLGGTSMDGTQSAAVFAYQAFAGLRYKINVHMGLSLEYHYFATTDATWRAESSSGTITDRLRFGGVQTHTATVAFDYRF